MIYSNSYAFRSSDILKNVGLQTKLDPTDFQCMVKEKKH